MRVSKVFSGVNLPDQVCFIKYNVTFCCKLRFFEAVSNVATVVHSWELNFGNGLVYVGDRLIKTVTTANNAKDTTPIGDEGISF